MYNSLFHGEVGKLLHQIERVVAVGEHREVVDGVTRADLDTVGEQQVVAARQMLSTKRNRHLTVTSVQRTTILASLPSRNE